MQFVLCVFIHSAVFVSRCFPASALRPDNSWYNSDKNFVCKTSTCVFSVWNLKQSFIFVNWSICVFHRVTGIKLNSRKKESFIMWYMYGLGYCICTTESFWILVVTTFNVAFSFSLMYCNVVNDLYNMI